jgi:hypothetical protein
MTNLADDVLAEVSPKTDGEALLEEVRTYLARFVVYPSAEAHVAHTLWVAHTHLFLSPEPASGKTRALEITETLVPRPVEAINTTPAYLFRKVSDPKGLPTILYDEIDTLFGPRAKDNEEVRGVLNAGHRRGAMAGRCVMRGKEILTEELPAFCAVALAGIGNLPDTIITRSVVIRMRRRAPNEHVEPYRRRIHASCGHALRERFAAWAAQVGPSLEGVAPEMPSGVEDRDADVWEPLLAVADAAGGAWPSAARLAAVALVTLAKKRTPSLGVRLLADLWAVFNEPQVRHVMATSQILEALNGMEEAPWGDLKGKPLDARRLANYLRQYGIESKVVRIGERTFKGYSREDLHDAWVRYLGSQEGGKEGNKDNDTGQKVTDVTHVTHVGDYSGQTCPRCDGEGCRWCRGTGRIEMQRTPSGWTTGPGPSEFTRPDTYDPAD